VQQLTVMNKFKVVPQFFIKQVNKFVLVEVLMVVKNDMVSRSVMPFNTNKKLRGLSLLADYTDRATAACR
jgi:hypothetical protein